MAHRVRFSETIRRSIRTVEKKGGPFLPPGSDFVVTNPIAEGVTTNNGADDVIVSV